MAGDPHWASVVLAMHMDGANASTVFTDVKGHAVTAVGNAKISTTQSKFGGASALFDGTGDYLTVADSDDFAFGTGAFEISCFLNLNAAGAVAARTIVGQQASTIAANSLAFYLAVSAGNYTALVLKISNGSTETYPSASFAFAVGVQYHVAVSRVDGVIRFFVDGVQIGSDIANTYAIPNSSAPLRVGRWDNQSFDFNGYIDELVIKKGDGHTASFTPPAAAFLEYAGQLTGTVRDAAGALCARTVRAYKRSDGSLIGSAISNAATGVYSFNTQTLDACTLIVLDDDAGTAYNALVFDKVIPA